MLKKLLKNLIPFLSLYFIVFSNFVFASESSSNSSSEHTILIKTLYFFALILFLSKLGALVEKFGIPSVLGELSAGILISFLIYLNVPSLEGIKDNEILSFLAEFGAILLLFQTGLESNIFEMLKVGVKSLLVAVTGVIWPFILGAFILGPYLFPSSNLSTLLFIGASLVATSVGITASVFRSQKIIKTSPAKIVLGAAVIDDILGLLILSVVSGLVIAGSISVPSILVVLFKAGAFLLISIFIGHFFADKISYFFSKIHSGEGTKLSLAIIFALLYSYLASLAGLEPIIGAFAAGLVLDVVHFKYFDLPSFFYAIKDLSELNGSKKDKQVVKKIRHLVEHTHVENMISSLTVVFVPLFFAYVGMQVDIKPLLNPSMYLSAFILTIFAIFTKVIAGFSIKTNLKNQLLIGFSMVPRGEVGLIFLSVGKGYGVLPSNVFSVLLLTIILTTFIAPFAIKKVAK